MLQGYPRCPTGFLCETVYRQDIRGYIYGTFRVVTDARRTRRERRNHFEYGIDGNPGSCSSVKYLASSRPRSEAEKRLAEVVHINVIADDRSIASHCNLLS